LFSLSFRARSDTGSFNIENLVLRARAGFNGFAGEDCERFWSTGVLEYWSVGKSESPNFNLNAFFHYSNTPPLQHSSRLPQRGKSIEAPSGGSPKPGPLGLDSLFVMTLSMKKLDRLCLAIVVIISAVCGYWTVSYGNKQRRQIKQEEEIFSKRLKDLNLADTNLQRLKATLDATRLELETLNERVPEKAKMGEFLKKVDSLMKERQVVLIQLEPQPTVEHKLYTRISVRLLFKGSFVNTYRLINDLETMHRKLIIEKMRISKSENDHDCRVDLTAAVFARHN